MEHKTRTKTLSWLLSLAMLFSLVPGMSMTAMADSEVSYQEGSWSNNSVTYTAKKAVNPTTLTNNTTAWTGGNWYVVPADGVEISTRITVTGTANLILTDGNTLTASKGITVADGNTLNIYAQSEGDTAGSLLINSVDDYKAGIGGGANLAGGIINVYGGTVNATGGNQGAGIGGGANFAGGIINVYGGTVNATGGNQGAGIGGGYSGGGGTVTIYGGTVTATGSSGAAGIGGGSSGNAGSVTINGGTVTAQGGTAAAGIGGGTGGNGGTVAITGGTVTATGGAHGAGIGGGHGGNGGALTVSGTGALTATGGGTEKALKLTAAPTITGMQVKAGAAATETIIKNAAFTANYTTYKWVCIGIFHTHDFTYTASGAVITATCANTDGYCPLPDDGDGNHTATLTIKPPANLVYSGSAKEATVENNIPGLDVNTLTITYTKNNAEVNAADVKEIGYYAASVTLGGQTASVIFEIKDNTYTIIIPATLDVENAGWNATAGITAKGEIAEDKKLTVTATSANNWALTKAGQQETIAYKLAESGDSTTTYAGATEKTVWDFSVTDLAGNGTTKPMGAVVEEYINKPAGDYTDTVTFTAEVKSLLNSITIGGVNSTELIYADGDTWAQIVDRNPGKIYIHGTQIWRGQDIVLYVGSSPVNINEPINPSATYEFEAD